MEKQISRFIPQYSGDLDAWAKALSTFLNAELGALFGKMNSLLDKTAAPHMGHFHSTLVNNADITITGCPFKPRSVFFLSEGDHGFAVGWDNITTAIYMGVYGGLPTVAGSGATGDASWGCIDTALISSYGRVTSFTADGFITHQRIGATSGLALRVQYILFP